MRNMAEGGIKGFILPPPLCDDQSILDLVAELGAVAIAVGPGKATGTQASVTIDDFQAAYDMTKHIIDLGHKRIGFIRSEEHTSELQSLMRISYAVLFLKKNKADDLQE